MVLELRPPHDSNLASLRPIWPVFSSYVLSFVYLGIYWNNHHHLLHAAQHVNGRVLWANLHLLFWLSLVPFVTAWMGENLFTGSTVALYGVVLLFAGIAYVILVRALLSLHGSQSLLAIAMGRDFKGKISLVLYLAGIALSFVNNWVAFAIYAFVAVMWLVPDKRIERRVSD